MILTVQRYAAPRVFPHALKFGRSEGIEKTIFSDLSKSFLSYFKNLLALRSNFMIFADKFAANVANFCLEKSSQMKTIVIFGATSAIAKAVARLYAKEANALFLVGRNEEQTQTLASDLKVRGAKAVHYAIADLAKPEQHSPLIATIKQVFPKIDIVLIAHGVLPNQDACNQDAEKTIDAMTVNFISPISLLTLLANEMQAQGAGVIAVISSVAGERGRQSNYVYGAAKGGLSIFLQGMRNRLYAKGVAVLTIKPGFVDTPMTASFKKGALWAKPEQVAKGIVKAIEKRRDEVYLPAFWKWIMLVIRQIPESLFKRLSL